MQVQRRKYIKKSLASTDFIHPSQKELVYDTRTDIDYEHDQATPPGLRPVAADNRSTFGLERAAHDLAAVPGDGHR
jgi:hypothetical protein